jgi:hypothetical protein
MLFWFIGTWGILPFCTLYLPHSGKKVSNGHAQESYPWFTRNTKKAYGVSPPPMSLLRLSRSRWKKLGTDKAVI